MKKLLLLSLICGQALADSTTLTLSWQPVTADTLGGPETPCCYNVQLVDPLDYTHVFAVKQVDAKTFTYIWTALVPNTNYCANVIAVGYENKLRTSLPSAAVCKSTDAPVLPQLMAPTGAVLK